jgi:LemA protein
MSYFRAAMFTEPITCPWASALYSTVQVDRISAVGSNVIPGIVVVVLVLAVVFYGIVIFNRLVTLRNRLREAWSGVDVQLKRRHDLVPNLVECVKGYRSHEQSLLESIARNRSAAQSVQGAAKAGSVENELTRNLRSLFAVAEAYPELKADKNFRQLSSSLVEIEDHLQYARRFYNGTVRDLNNLAQSFPSSLIAGLFHFQSAEFFEVESATERLAPEVKL